MAEALRPHAYVPTRKSESTLKMYKGYGQPLARVYKPEWRNKLIRRVISVGKVTRSKKQPSAIHTGDRHLLAIFYNLFYCDHPIAPINCAPRHGKTGPRSG